MKTAISVCAGVVIATLCLAAEPAAAKTRTRHAAKRPDPACALTLTRGSRLMIPILINGHHINALVDSAAEVTLVDSFYAKLLHLKPKKTVAGQGSGQAGFDAGLVDGVELQALGLDLKNQTVAVTDLSDVGKRLLGKRLDVILGREIFDAARLSIDVTGRCIKVVPRDVEPKGVKLPLVTEHGIETVPVSVEGHDALRAAFDLGNGTQVLIGSALAERLHLLSGRTVTHEKGGGLGGEANRQIIELKDLEVAGRKFTKVPAAIDTQPGASDVNIGIAVLQHFRITTDYAQHAVWLDPRD